MGDWLSTSVLLDCELQPLAEDVVASIARGFQFHYGKWQNCSPGFSAPRTVLWP